MEAAEGILGAVHKPYYRARPVDAYMVLVRLLYCVQVTREVIPVDHVAALDPEVDMGMPLVVESAELFHWDGDGR